jgi:hypothetical protein
MIEKHYSQAIDQKTKTNYRVEKMFKELKSDMWAESAESQYADPQLTAMKRKQKQFMVNMSVANVINGVREYYEREHDMQMAFVRGQAMVVTPRQFEQYKELGLIDHYANFSGS